MSKKILAMFLVITAIIWIPVMLFIVLPLGWAKKSICGLYSEILKDLNSNP